MRLKDIGISLRDEKKVLRNGMILLVFAAVLVLVLMRFDQVWGAVLTVVGTVAPVFYGIVLAYILDVFVHFFEDVAFKPLRNVKSKLWKRVRKYGAFCTGITQNVDDLLQSHTARTMLSNSEFIVMLNQAATDRVELAKLLNISDLQLSYITNVDAGHGLIKVGSSLVPFANKFPRDTKLYRLMTTKFGEN